jgi:hypothetical protein
MCRSSGVLIQDDDNALLWVLIQDDDVCAVEVLIQDDDVLTKRVKSTSCRRSWNRTCMAQCHEWHIPFLHFITGHQCWVRIVDRDNGCRWRGLLVRSIGRGWNGSTWTGWCASGVINVTMSHDHVSFDRSPLRCLGQARGNSSMHNLPFLHFITTAPSRCLDHVHDHVLFDHAPEQNTCVPQCTNAYHSCISLQPHPQDVLICPMIMSRLTSASRCLDQAANHTSCRVLEQNACIAQCMWRRRTL